MAAMPALAAAALVFGTSAAVLVLEILAGRLLAPYVGVTLETYTGVIGVVLAAIALGTWWGGRLADRRDPRGLIGPLLVGGGGLALCAVPAIRLVGSLGLGAGAGAILLLSTIGFFAPAAVLSAVSPAVVKLQLHDLEETGSVVGRLSALGTAGALVGTFVTGFVLVAALPTTPIVYGVGTVLVLVGLAVHLTVGRRSATARTGPGVLPLLGLAAFGVAGAPLVGPCQVETTYFCARVDVDPQRPTGRVLWLDVLRHSYVDLADPTHLEFSYAQNVADVLSTVRPGEPLDALHIGGGGFSVPRWIRATRPDSSSLVLELDPTIVRIGQEQLGLELGPDLRVRVGDARVGLRDQPDDAYDVVVGDAFGGQAVPWHLTTKEFVGEIRRTLRPDGVYVLNLIDYPPLAFARAEAATLDAVFEHVVLLTRPERVARREGGNFVLAASDEPFDLDGIRAAVSARGDDDAVASGDDLAGFIGDARVLRDDRAPVDQLMTPAT